MDKHSIEEMEHYAAVYQSELIKPQLTQGSKTGPGVVARNLAAKLPRKGAVGTKALAETATQGRETLINLTGTLWHATAQSAQLPTENFSNSFVSMLRMTPKADEVL